MTPLRALLLACVAALPARASDKSPTAPRSSDAAAEMTMPMGNTAAPTSAIAVVPHATKAQAARTAAFVSNSMSDVGKRYGIMSAESLGLNHVRNADEAHVILDEMAHYIQHNADAQYKAIGGNTVRRISQSISDDDFEAIRPELAKLPDMLKVQLASDEFRTKHDMNHLSDEDKRFFQGLQDRYNSLMPPGQKSASTQQQAAHPMTMSSPESVQTAAVAGVKPVLHPPLMDEFHNDWRVETKAWADAHPAPAPVPAPVPQPSPIPVPGPAPDPSGTGVVSNGGGVTGNGGGAQPPIGYPPIQHIDDMISNSPSEPSNWQMRADYKLESGDYDGAASDAQRALSLGGGDSARDTLGEAKLSLGDKPAAHEQAVAVLSSNPNDPRAQALLHFSEGFASVAAPKAPSFGGSSDAGGVPAASAASAVNAAALAAARAAGMSSAQAKKEAQNALKLGDLDGALVYVNRALSQNPDNPDLLNVRAAIDARMHNYEQAIADAKAGLALAPKNKTLLQTLGYAQLRGKHYKDAKSTADEMLSIDPANPYAFALRAHAEGDLGEKDAMMSDINRAAALDPRYAGAAADLAKLVQIPTDTDTLFLFPGETAPAAKTAAPSAPGRGRAFGALVGAAIVGGLLLALGLMKTVMAPLTERITSAFTRRSGAAGIATEDAAPASVNGLMPGLIRGQYEISRQIGAGGMGMVFEGTDRSLGRRVAIKKMRDELRVNPQERARFVIEAKTVAALHHTNIVDIYAIAEEGDDVFLIFEYVDGKTAHELVQASGRLPPAQAAGIVRDVAGALDYAHAHSVIHRDMKPSNVMIDAAGRVKVMDFGIARMAKDSMTRYSMTNTVVGTPPYMAPEQEQGHVRKESDVYALAVCAYEMITGKLPFIGIGAGMLMNKINMSYVAPSRAIAGLPEALDPVFARAFQADPDKRFRTPKEFADAFDSARGAQAKAS